MNERDKQAISDQVASLKFFKEQEAGQRVYAPGLTVELHYVCPCGCGVVIHLIGNMQLKGAAQAMTMKLIATCEAIHEHIEGNPVVADLEKMAAPYPLTTLLLWSEQIDKLKSGGDLMAKAALCYGAGEDGVNGQKPN